MANPRILGAILLFAGSPGIAAAQPDSQDLNNPQSEELQTSDWGPETNGLQLRVTLPKRLEQGKSIEVAAEFRSEPAMLPPGVRALNPCRDMGSYFHLHLTNLDGGFLSILDASTRVFGPPPTDDDGRWATPFDPERNIRSTAYFTTLVEATPLASGRYRVQLVYDQPSTPNPGWRRGSEDWNARGFWRGKVASQPLEIEILPESSRTETIYVPKRLRFVKLSAGVQNRPGRGGFKTGHFESMKVRRTAFPAMVPEEAVDGESAQGGDGAFDSDASGAGLVAAAHRPHIGYPSRDGGPVRAISSAGGDCGAGSARRV